MPHLLSVVLATCLTFTTPPSDPPETPEARVPDARRTERQLRQEQLGRYLFRSRELSVNREVSCASCHDFGLSFTDGEAESRGILGIGVGRNAPTLVEIAHVGRFPGPRVGATRLEKRIGALTLEERCLAPIENPLEMGFSVAAAVDRLEEIEGLNDAFKAAFGPTSFGINIERIGRSLAAFLRSIESPETRYHRFMAGDENALSPLERHGERLFRGAGECASCHTGEALSDGLAHVAFRPGSPRDAAQAVRFLEIRRTAFGKRDDLGIDLPERGISRQLFEALRPPAPVGCMETGGQSGYGGFTQGGITEVQTLPLWDVARTGPYFRDGSVDDLEAAIHQHVGELRSVSEHAADIARALREKDKTDARMAPRLRPRFSRRPAPADLDASDLAALTAFLTTFSPNP